MATYFDTTNADHRLLLPVTLRDYDDLAAIAAAAERDVIEHYTISTYQRPHQIIDESWVEVGDQMYVALRGYTEDAAGAGAAFALSMRLEIAALIRWKKAQWEKHPMHSVEFKAGMSTSIRPNAEQRRYPGFGQYLRKYDTRSVIHII